MLLSAKRIQAAMTLDARGVTSALLNSGYPGDKVDTAVFEGLSLTRVFVYRCTYTDRIEGTREHCAVFISYDEHNKLVAEY